MLFQHLLIHLQLLNILCCVCVNVIRGFLLSYSIITRQRNCTNVQFNQSKCIYIAPFKQGVLQMTDKRNFRTNVHYYIKSKD